MREQITAALFALLSGIAGIVTAERILRHWDDVQESEMPYLALSIGTNTPLQQTKFPTKWILEFMVRVYARHAGDVSPSATLNNLIDGIENALKPLAGMQLTLGGLVEYCRIEGEIVNDEGTLGELAVARVPIRVLVTAS